MQSLLSNNNSNNNMVQSVLTSLSQSIQSPQTQQTICNVLQSASKYQLVTMVSMANLNLKDRQIDWLVKMAHSITPQNIQTTVTITQRLVRVFKVLNKMVKILKKYRHVLTYLMLVQWIKSALYRPIAVVVSKKRRWWYYNSYNYYSYNELILLLLLLLL